MCIAVFATNINLSKNHIIDAFDLNQANIHGNEAGEQTEGEDKRAVKQRQSSIENTVTYILLFLSLTHNVPKWREIESNDSDC